VQTVHFSFSIYFWIENCITLALLVAPRSGELLKQMLLHGSVPCFRFRATGQSAVTVSQFVVPQAGFLGVSRVGASAEYSRESILFAKRKLLGFVLQNFKFV
jgi:hypothetical protein